MSKGPGPESGGPDQRGCMVQADNTAFVWERSALTAKISRALTYVIFSGVHVIFDIFINGSCEQLGVLSTECNLLPPVFGIDSSKIYIVDKHSASIAEDE
eukprot:gene8127-biopygen14513